MSFVAFIAPYYAERLHFYERLDLTRCPEAELLDVAGEASALHKFLTDILEEGSNFSCPGCCSTWGVPRNVNAFTSSQTCSRCPSSRPRRSQAA